MRLGVNIDHVATLRNARGGVHPDPVRAAMLAEQAGADSITFHLREDRRHIRDEDLDRIASAVSIPLNMEMAPVEQMVGIALLHRPHTVTLVPEKRQERTTEGGLDVVVAEAELGSVVARLQAGGVRVSLFIEPDPDQVRAGVRLGVRACEFHTGRYVGLRDGGDAGGARAERDRIAGCARLACELGLVSHAGHGLSYDTVGDIASIADIDELNIGHFLIGEAVCIGLAGAIGRMRRVMDQARST